MSTKKYRVQVEFLHALLFSKADRTDRLTKNALDALYNIYRELIDENEKLQKQLSDSISGSTGGDGLQSRDTDSKHSNTNRNKWCRKKSRTDLDHDIR